MQCTNDYLIDLSLQLRLIVFFVQSLNRYYFNPNLKITFFTKTHTFFFLLTKIFIYFFLILITC